LIWILYDHAAYQPDPDKRRHAGLEIKTYAQRSNIAPTKIRNEQLAPAARRPTSGRPALLHRS
jgi:hypothetical protein